MNRQRPIFVLIIFCGFAVSVFLVLLLSGSTYLNMVDMSRSGRDERIVLSYIRARIRTNDSADAITIGTFEGLSALILEENLYGRVFVTKIYLYDGWVRELFHEYGQEFAPSDGVPIIRVGSLSFVDKGSGMMQVSTDYASLLIYQRSVGS